MKHVAENFSIRNLKEKQSRRLKTKSQKPIDFDQETRNPIVIKSYSGRDFLG